MIFAILAVELGVKFHYAPAGELSCLGEGSPVAVKGLAYQPAIVGGIVDQDTVGVTDRIPQ